MRSQPPTVSYGDSLSIGQIAQMWERDAFFVRRLIEQEMLAVDERGLVTNAELGRFYRESGDLLNA
jgi:hypothetical protein